MSISDRPQVSHATHRSPSSSSSCSWGCCVFFSFLSVFLSFCLSFLLSFFLSFLLPLLLVFLSFLLPVGVVLPSSYCCSPFFLLSSFFFLLSSLLHRFSCSSFIHLPLPLHFRFLDILRTPSGDGKDLHGGSFAAADAVRVHHVGAHHGHAVLKGVCLPLPRVGLPVRPTTRDSLPLSPAPSLAAFYSFVFFILKGLCITNAHARRCCLCAWPRPLNAHVVGRGCGQPHKHKDTNRDLTRPRWGMFHNPHCAPRPV